jgi:hypothetical protein
VTFFIEIRLSCCRLVHRRDSRLKTRHQHLLSQRLHGHVATSGTEIKSVAFALITSTNDVLCFQKTCQLIIFSSVSTISGYAVNFMLVGWAVIYASSSSAFSLYPGGNAYVTAFDFPPFRWPHSGFGEGACLVQRFLVAGTHPSRT